MVIFVVTQLLTGWDYSHLIQRSNLHVDHKVPILGPLFLATTTPIIKSSVTCYLELLKALNCALKMTFCIELTYFPYYIYMKIVSQGEATHVWKWWFESGVWLDLETQLLEVRCMSMPTFFHLGLPNCISKSVFSTCVASPTMEGQTTFLVHLLYFSPPSVDTNQGHGDWCFLIRCEGMDCKFYVVLKLGFEYKKCTRKFDNMKLDVCFLLNFKISIQFKISFFKLKENEINITIQVHRNTPFILFLNMNKIFPKLVHRTHVEGH